MPAPTKTKRIAPELAPLPDASESRAAIATTVAWMLLTLSSAAAQTVALVMWLLARSAGIPANRPNALLLVTGTLMLVALLTGLLVLALTPLVHRVRKSRPPIAVTIVAVFIAILPLATLAILAVL